MYLSRLVLDPRVRQVRTDLGDCQQLHRTLMRAFPDAPDGEPGRAHAGTLFRIEPERCRTAAAGTARAQFAAPVVLVQSRLQPEWRRLPPEYLSGDLAEPAVVKDITGSLAHLRGGMSLRFRLRANVVMAQLDTKQPEGQRARGKRVAIHGEDAQLAWLARKGEAAGFQLPSLERTHFRHPDEDAEPSSVWSVRVMSEDDVRGRRRDPAAGDGAHPRMTFGAVLFEGALEVTDAEALRAVVAQGIGPGKAYGFGLLSLALGRSEGGG